MHELFPLVAGAVVGGAVMAFPNRSQWIRTGAFIVGCIVFGFLASWSSGELEESWGFLSIDMALVWFGGLVVVVLVTAWRYRSMIFRSSAGSSKDADKN